LWAGRSAPLQPSRGISSRIADAAASGSPAPPHSWGISAARYPASVSAATNSTGYSLVRSSARQYYPRNRAQSFYNASRIAGMVIDRLDAGAGHHEMRLPSNG